ncbi:MAG: 16S rRNA (cytidine(1402)-2'-O)-methyltransferase [Nitrospirae bacterium]|nr:16S rRNA (cytidine(1402)-2'-O)-methyltransferase [Nitrospirota bacterium]
MSAGTLYIVATPIGNLDDITLRALKTLREVSLIAAEDTRHTQKLLTHFGIHKTLTSYHDHNKEQKGEVLVARLKDGDDVALVSDAGTPGISDPGYYLINRAIEEGVAVIPIPGVAAATAALSVSGLPTDAFVFEGFLPARHSQRLRKLEELKAEPRTMIFYEAPHRILDCMKDMVKVLGDRRVSLSRELTKMHEETLRGRIHVIIDIIGQKAAVKGEITLVVEGRTSEPVEESVLSLADHVEKLVREEGISKKDAIAKVAKLRGVPKREVYNETI